MQVECNAGRSCTYFSPLPTDLLITHTRAPSQFTRALPRLAITISLSKRRLPPERESGSWKNSSWILGNSSCPVDVERTNDYWQQGFQSGFADPKNQALHRRVTDYLRTKPGLVPLNLATRGTRAPYQALILSQKCLAMIHKTRAELN